MQTTTKILQIQEQTCKRWSFHIFSQAGKMEQVTTVYFLCSMLPSRGTFILTNPNKRNNSILQMHAYEFTMVCNKLSSPQIFLNLANKINKTWHTKDKLYCYTIAFHISSIILNTVYSRFSTHRLSAFSDYSPKICGTELFAI